MRNRRYLIFPSNRVRAGSDKQGSIGSHSSPTTRRKVVVSSHRHPSKSILWRWILSSTSSSSYQRLGTVQIPTCNPTRFFLQKRFVPFHLALTILLLFNRCPYLFFCSWKRNTLYDADFSVPIPASSRTFHERVQYIRDVVQQGKVYEPIASHPTSSHADGEEYNVLDCPLHPPPGYPREYPIMDLLDHWPTSSVDPPTPNRMIHQGLCVFDVANSTDTSVLDPRIRNYRAMEVPFIVRNDPHALVTAERWNMLPNYLEWKLQQRVFHGEFSQTNSMMFWFYKFWDVWGPSDFQPPTSLRPITMDQLVQRAREVHQARMTTTTPGNIEKAYMRIDGCAQRPCAANYRMPFGSLPGWINGAIHLSDGDLLVDELPFLNPHHPASRPYELNSTQYESLQCRFGMDGVTAENHFDSTRNWIAVLTGERRYILSHPRHCAHMALYPQDHPLGRHSRVNYEQPDLKAHPEFARVAANEVVLQAGELLYLPTQWFHHIVSLSYNVQCSTRDGYSLKYDPEIDGCGFLYPLPEYPYGKYFYR